MVQLYWNTIHAPYLSHLKFKSQWFGCICTQTQACVDLSWHGWKRQCFCTTKKVAGHTEQQFSEEAVGSSGMPATLDREKYRCPEQGSKWRRRRQRQLMKDPGTKTGVWSCLTCDGKKLSWGLCSKAVLGVGREGTGELHGGTVAANH